jgi:hypothetical protein
VVGYDSIIPPGRVGSITESVNLSNYHDGSYSKSATITSNAKKTPTMQVTMKWVIKAFVKISPTYLEFLKNKSGDFGAEVTLSSEKADLKLLEVSFRSNAEQAPNKMPAWQEELPVHLSAVLLKDTVMQAKMHDFKFKITATYGDTKSKNGEFLFKTNHPDAPEVKANGLINPGTSK